MKLLRGTYGNDAVTRTTRGDQISVRLDGQTAVINLNSLVRKKFKTGLFFCRIHSELLSSFLWKARPP